MDKRTGTIITIAGAGVAFCLCVGCAGGGIGWSIRGDTFQPLGLILLCPALLTWALPILLWVFLVRDKDDEAKDVA